MSELNRPANRIPHRPSRRSARPSTAIGKPIPGVFSEASYIELLPQGVVLGLMENRPMLLLRSEDGAHTLPVWLNEVQTPAVLAELGHNGGFDRAHGITFKIMKQLGGVIRRCVFTDLAGVHPFVDIHIAQKTGVDFVERARADEAMALVLGHKAKILATRSFIENCRSVQMDVRDLDHLQGDIQDAGSSGSRILQ